MSQQPLYALLTRCFYTTYYNSSNNTVVPVYMLNDVLVGVISMHRNRDDTRVACVVPTQSGQFH